MSINLSFAITNSGGFHLTLLQTFTIYSFISINRGGNTCYISFLNFNTSQKDIERERSSAFESTVKLSYVRYLQCKFVFLLGNRVRIRMSAFFETRVFSSVCTNTQCISVHAIGLSKDMILFFWARQLAWLRVRYHIRARVLSR